MNTLWFLNYFYWVNIIINRSASVYNYNVYLNTKNLKQNCISPERTNSELSITDYTNRSSACSNKSEPEWQTRNFSNMSTQLKYLNNLEKYTKKQSK